MLKSPFSALALGAVVIATAAITSACADSTEPAPTTSRVVEDAPDLADAPEFTPPVVDIHKAAVTGSPVVDSRKVSCDDIAPLEENASRDTGEGRWWPVDGGWVLADGIWCI